MGLLLVARIGTFEGGVSSFCMTSRLSDRRERVESEESHSSVAQTYVSCSQKCAMINDDRIMGRREQEAVKEGRMNRCQQAKACR